MNGNGRDRLTASSAERFVKVKVQEIPVKKF